MSTRRTFLQHCSTLAGAAALTPWSALARPSALGGKEVRSDDLGLAIFASQVNTIFRVQVAPARVLELELIKVNCPPDPPRDAARPQHRAPEYERFSLIFRGPPEGRLPERPNQFEHRELGRFEMFVAPVLPRDSAGRYYEAVFNRPVRDRRGIV